MRSGPRVEAVDQCPWIMVGKGGSVYVRENSFASSFGWVIVTVPSVLCARCSPRKLVASRSSVTS